MVEHKLPKKLERAKSPPRRKVFHANPVNFAKRMREEEGKAGKTVHTIAYHLKQRGKKI